MKVIGALFVVFVVASCNCFAADKDISEYLPRAIKDFSEQYTEATSRVNAYIDAADGDYKEILKNVSAGRFRRCVDILKDPVTPISTPNRTKFLELFIFCLPVLERDSLEEIVHDLYANREKIKVFEFSDIKMCADFYAYLGLYFYKIKNGDLGQYFCHESGYLHQSFEEFVPSLMKLERRITPVEDIYCSCTIYDLFPNLRNTDGAKFSVRFLK